MLVWGKDLHAHCMGFVFWMCVVLIFSSFSYDEELAILNYVEYQLTNTRGKALDHYQENIDKAIPMLSNISKLQSILKSNIQKKVQLYR